MDLHQKEIQGFFDVPIDNLRGSPFLIQYIQDQVSICNQHNINSHLHIMCFGR